MMKVEMKSSAETAEQNAKVILQNKEKQHRRLPVRVR